MECGKESWRKFYVLCKLRRNRPALENKEDMLRTLNNAQYGWFDEKSWNFWRLVLDFSQKIYPGEDYGAIKLDKNISNE
jgi:hypothetical protein